MFPQSFQIIDISQPVSSKTTCFPGDVPFTRELTLSFEQSQVVNLTAITMSPHVGTHADAPSHIKGDIADETANIGAVPLAPYVGTAVVVDLSPMPTGAITADLLKTRVRAGDERVLVKTQTTINFEKWEGDYPYLSIDAVDYLKSCGIKLIGLDVPSVDHVNSKNLEAHHALNTAGLYWLENLNLTSTIEGRFFLVALPLKLTEAEASPVRAILLT